MPERSPKELLADKAYDADAMGNLHRRRHDYLRPDDTPAKLESLSRHIVDRQADDQVALGRLLQELSQTNRDSANRVADALHLRDEQTAKMFEHIKAITQQSR